MNSYFLIPVVALLINIFIWSYVFGQRQKEPVSAAFLLFTGDVLLWLVMEILYHIPAFQGHEVPMLRIGSLFWIPLGILFLNFAYAVVDRKRDPIFYFGIFVCIIGIILNWSTNLFIRSVEYHEWGFNQVSHPFNHSILVGVLLVFCLYGLALVFQKWRCTDDLVEKKVCLLILYGGVIVVVITMTLNVVIPNFFPMIAVPQFGNVSLVIFQLMVFLAVTRFRFLSISVENVAEELFEDVQDGILLLDRSQRIRRANREARRLLGHKLLGRLITDFFSPDDFSKLVSRQEITIRNGRETYTLTASSVASSMMRSRHLVNVLAIRDITAQKKAEAVLKGSRDELEGEVARWTEQLRRAQKMETLGTIAGSIAHDFNNLLAAILGFTQAARNDLPEQHPVREDLDEVLSAGNRAKDIIRQILSFSRKEACSAYMVMSIDAVVQDAMDLLRVSFPTTIYITYSNELSCGTVRCDPAEILQVLMNLGTNALQAMICRGSGVLQFVLRNQTIGENEDIHADLSSGDYVTIEVHDNGIGIDNLTMTRIFNPFFTTKAPGEGTGLGLSTALGIIQGHDGTILVDSVPGDGSTFSVWLPLVSEVSFEATRPVGATAGTERILLLDDDEQLRKVATRMLAPLGYQLQVEKSGTAGLTLFESDPEAFDLVITDHAMPNMTGVELARQIKMIRHDIPIILISGYLDDLSLKEMMKNGISDFVKKPFTQALLSERIRKVLESK